VAIIRCCCYCMCGPLMLGVVFVACFLLVKRVRLRMDGAEHFLVLRSQFYQGLVAPYVEEAFR
jgi:hypothetical protein